MRRTTPSWQRGELIPDRRDLSGVDFQTLNFEDLDGFGEGLDGLILRGGGLVGQIDVVRIAPGGLGCLGGASGLFENAGHGLHSLVGLVRLRGGNTRGGSGLVESGVDLGIGCTAGSSLSGGLGGILGRYSVIGFGRSVAGLRSSCGGLVRGVVSSLLGILGGSIDGTGKDSAGVRYESVPRGRSCLVSPEIGAPDPSLFDTAGTADRCRSNHRVAAPANQLP
ncbi:hypothetical protein [Nocardia ninae]|uniref:hypothetical protein n=1 Tax=Nocardia ninae TaxID=356145 RepID=UPI0011BD75E7|nr:hypothetical protein [Nocardia ninae]